MEMEKHMQNISLLINLEHEQYLFFKKNLLHLLDQVFLKAFSECALVSQATPLCPTLCDPMDCGMLGFPILHHCPEFAQTHVH